MAASFRPERAPKRALSRRKPPSWRRPRFRPRLEPLESRTLLSSPGTLNPKFGTDGLVSTNFGASDSPATVVTQPDGKIVVVGTDIALDGSSSQIAIARYNKHGSLDKSFGSDGKVLALFGPLDIVQGAAVRPDGKIIVDAWEETSPNSFQYENLLVQFNGDGTLDTDFGTGGSVVTPGFLASGSNPITFGPQGEIVVVGIPSSSSFSPPMKVAEFNPDGTPNQNFGSGGIATISAVQGFPTAADPRGTFRPSGDAVAVDPQGRILVAGSVAVLGQSVVSGGALFRLNTDGTLDKTFGFNGSITNVFGFLGGQVTAIAIRPNDQIVVAGQAADPTTSRLLDFAVEQFNPDGTQDLRFGFDGVVGTTIPNVNLYVTGLAIQHSGDVVVVGGTELNHSPFTQGFAMARYTPNGNPDLTFGTDGIVTTFFPQTSGGLKGAGSNVTNVALTPGGNIVVAGTVVDPVTGNSDFGVAEYLGKPPAPFRRPPPRPPAPVPPPLYPSSVSAPPQPPPGPFGKLDPAFGTGGLVTSSPGTVAAGIATQADGKIVAVGDSSNTGGLVVVRYNPDGSLDQSFGTGGVVNTVVGLGDFFGSVAIQPDGQIVVAAVEYTRENGVLTSKLLLVRYNSDGSLDQSFGSGGIVITALPDGQNFVLGSSSPSALGPFASNAVTLTDDGRIVVVGTASTTTGGGPQNTGLVIAEYDQDGNLVPDFGSDGLVITTSFTDAAGNTITAPEANSVALDRRGRIYVAGSALTSPHSSQVALLARYNPDGTLDQTFGFQGAVTSVFDVADSNVYLPTGIFASAVAVRPDGKIIVAGGAIDPQSLDPSFAVEQFNRDGSPDLKFGSHAIALWGGADGFGGAITPTALVLQPSGGIVVAGSTDFSSAINQFGMIRLRPDGTFDPSFGSNGVVTANFPNGQLTGPPIFLAQEPNGDIVAEETVKSSIFPGQLGLAEYTAGPPGPALAAGFALPSGAISDAPSPPTSSAQSTAVVHPATARSGTLTDAFFTLLSGATNHAPSNQDGSFLDGMGVLLPATQSPSLPVVGSTFVTSKLVPSPAMSSSPTAAFVAALSEEPPHAVSMPDSGGDDVLEPSALDALFASADVLEPSAPDPLFASPG